MTDEPMSLESPEMPAPEGRASDRRTNPGLRRFLAPLVIVLLGLLLYVPGLRWGLPGTVSWSQDTIAGPRTLGAVAGWPDEWYGRYPPLHYFLLYAAYQPPLTYWKLADGLSTHPETGNPVLKEPHAPKIGLLLLIARIVSVVMAIAAGLGTWAATKVLTGDEFAASLPPCLFIAG